MLTLSEVKFPKILDNTIVSGWETCPAKAFMSYFLHLKPKGTRVHLHAGKCFAKALEVYRLNYFVPTSPNYHKPEESMLEGLRALIKDWGYDEEVDREFEHTNKTFDRIVELYLGYFTRFGYKTDPMKPAFFNGIPMIESNFTLQLDLNHPDTGDPLLFHGRYDMLIDYHSGIFVYDDKTCSQLGKMWADKWATRSQFTGYCYGARANGYPVIGAVVRGSCVYKNDVGYAESISYRKGWELDKWWEDLHHSAHNMIETYGQLRNKIEDQKGKKTPINPIQLTRNVPARGMFSEACQAYGGCEFLPLCKSEFPQRWLSDFAVDIWDPTNPDKEEK